LIGIILNVTQNWFDENGQFLYFQAGQFENLKRKTLVNAQEAVYNEGSRTL
jgi:hypothetical protein